MGVISWFDHTVEVNNRLTEESCLISFASIIKKKLFDIIIDDRGSEQRWPKMTPFDFEKAPTDTKWLPLRRANPKDELFASIDDDLGVVGSSLQSRGLYPKRSGRQSYAMHSQSLMVRARAKLLKSMHIFAFTSYLNGIIQTPKKYRLDYIKSISNCLTPAIPLPWINYVTVDFIIKKLSLITNVFEYGSGQSTLFWLSQGKSVVSIEHDAQFYEQLFVKVTQMGNVDYRLIEPEIDAIGNTYQPESPKYYHSGDFKGYCFKSYVESISVFPDESFDVVVIDGRARTACIVHSINKIKCGGMLILDNSNRQYYLENTLQLISDWIRYDFVGTVRGLMHLEQTSIFIKPKLKSK